MKKAIIIVLSICIALIFIEKPNPNFSFGDLFYTSKTEKKTYLLLAILQIYQHKILTIKYKTKQIKTFRKKKNSNKIVTPVMI